MSKPVFSADLPNCCRRQLRNEEGIPDRFECPSCGAIWKHEGWMFWRPGETEKEGLIIQYKAAARTAAQTAERIAEERSK